MEKTNLNGNEQQIGNAGSQENVQESVNSMPVEKQKMFARPFSFSGRIRRLEYGITYLIAIVFQQVLASLAVLKSDSVPLLLLVLVLSIIFAWFLLAQGAKRCHDRGNSGWYQIIPFYSLWMIFADGEDYENEYGHDPKGRNSMAEFEV